MTKVLVTGFGPYGVTPDNPAQFTAEALDGRTIAGATVVSRIVPGAYFDSIAAAEQAIAEVDPQLVIMLGEYPGRAMLTVERLAQNINDCGRYGLADTAGKVLVGEPTDPDGPVAYHATVPVHEMVLAMRAAGFPADVSDAAGTFVCNHLMYGVLHHIATQNLPIRAGCVHLPCLPMVAALDRNLGVPSMSVETAVAGLVAGIEAAVHHSADTREPVPSRLQI
ncbi:Pyrrolidone-carboxylate peptidase [Mycobacterium shottsii]|uniref:Pyrrolidone-carboxylate peptidase n=1 Tax=Mycobacterium shottsii TaxID=133549 RepID=A0A7I7LB57_9MYCO|nr:pyroglutamyl-peptidase I [Mycobacterium shottsii]QYL27258.1 Pyrrolidone-carboxylate peptidase [Mycobacterium shottsii]BBX56978.1 pyrrolidone-carboxylate peptidase [Mycobacterium shottsii]